MRLLLDTNTLSYLTKGKQPALDRLEESIEKEAIFLLGPVVEFELTRYLELRGMPRLFRNYLKITASWQRCDLSFSDWREAARLWAERLGSVGRSPIWTYCWLSSRGGRGQCSSRATQSISRDSEWTCRIG
jgi:predicted nucleic acid-binding protein